MNENRKHENDVRRKHIKEMLNSLYGANKQSPSEKITIIYHEAIRKFMAKGDDETIAKEKAFHAISLFIPKGYGVKLDEEKDILTLAKIKEAKNGR